MEIRKLTIIILSIVLFNGCDAQDTSIEKSMTMKNECQTLQDIVTKTLVVRKNLKLLSPDTSKIKKHEFINRIHEIESKLARKGINIQGICNQLEKLNLELKKNNMSKGL